jgi:integrase
VLVGPYLKNDGSTVRFKMTREPRLHALVLSLAEGLPREGYLFGRRRGRGWVRKAVQEICDAAGLPRMTAHGMRGTMASHDYGDHGDIDRTAARLGDTAAVALDHYVSADARIEGDAIRIQRALRAVPRAAPARAESFANSLSDKENDDLKAAK